VRTALPGKVVGMTDPLRSCAFQGQDRRGAEGKGLPLGLMPGMGCEEKETILEAGEAVLFYSDGLVEAHDSKGEMFGFPRLRELVAEHGKERSLEEALLEELYSFVGEPPLIGQGCRRGDDRIASGTMRHDGSVKPKAFSQGFGVDQSEGPQPRSGP
jgi:hypothetical protein